MWHVDTPTRDELKLFADFSEPGLVTILLPTTPVTAQVQADRIQLKNLGAEAIARLAELGVRSTAEVAEVADEISDLVDDDTFWAHQSHGLAVIVVPDHVWTLRLPVPVGPSVHVGDRVPLMPLLASAVDAALRPVIAGSELPLVLAAGEPIRSIYRAASSYPHLLEEALETNPDRSSDQDLAIAAREILDRDLRAQLGEYAQPVERRRSHSRVGSDLADVARSAARGPDTEQRR